VNPPSGRQRRHTTGEGRQPKQPAAPAAGTDLRPDGTHNAQDRNLDSGPESATKLAQDTTTCTGQGCGATIRWVITIAGRRMPINPDPHPDGTIIREVTPEGIRARVLTGDQLPAQQTAWQPHWVTCPDSPQFRDRKARTTPRCRACSGPLDPWLVAQGRPWHVLCEPPTRAEIEAAMRHAKTRP